MRLRLLSIKARLPSSVHHPRKASTLRFIDDHAPPPARSPPPPPQDPAPTPRNTPDTPPHPRKRMIRTAMSAPGHNDARPTAKSLPKDLLSVSAHRIDRPDIKASYIDTHCHLATTLRMLQQKTGDVQTVPGERVDLLVKELFPENVKAVVDVHCDLPWEDGAEKAVKGEWGRFAYYFSAGAHPHVAALYSDQTHEKYLELMTHPRCVAWGECGLDYFKNPPQTHSNQQAVFIRQIQGAVLTKKPLVVHTRDADADSLSILLNNAPKHWRIHIHCCTSSAALVEPVLANFPNAYIGITGVVTYNLPHMKKMIRDETIPLSRMLLETDSPFMVPSNVYGWMKKNRKEAKGKKFAVCHAGMIPWTAEKVADWINEGRKERGVAAGDVDVEEVLETTRKNAETMYGISLSDGPSETGPKGVEDLK